MIKRLLITLLTLLAGLPAVIVLAATALSDGELIGISGGGIDPHLEGQSLPQEQQQPTNNAVDYAPAQPLNKSGGIDLTPEFIAILQSGINAVRDRKVLLDRQAQQGVLAFNLENLNSSDVVSTNNVFDGSSLPWNEATSEVEINQFNNLNQLHRSQGRLSSSIAGHRYETMSESRSGSNRYYSSSRSVINQLNQSELVRIETFFNTAQVGSHFTSWDEIAEEVMPISLVEPAILVHPIRLEIFKDTILESWYTGFTVTGIGFDLDSIKAGGDRGLDLVLQTSLITPLIDFGKARLWPLDEADFGELGGDSVRLPVIAIPGLAPNIDELNLGTGFAVNGDGNLSTIEPGNIRISGDATFDMTAHIDFTIDFSKAPGFGDVVSLFGIKPLTTSQEFNLIHVEIPFELLDQPFGVIDIVQHDPGHWSEETILSQNNDLIEEYSAVDIAESRFNESYQHNITSGGQMTGAEADLIALSEGSLSLDNSSVLSLGDAAQQDLRVFNGTNAVSSVAANALNISRLPVFRGNPSRLPRSTTTQLNRFNQRM